MISPILLQNFFLCRIEDYIHMLTCPKWRDAKQHLLNPRGERGQRVLLGAVFLPKFKWEYLIFSNDINFQYLFAFQGRKPLYKYTRRSRRGGGSKLVSNLSKLIVHCWEFMRNIWVGTMGAVGFSSPFVAKKFVKHRKLH